MIQTYQCPKGHDSSEPDFCSECGIKIQGGSATNGSTPNGATGKTCPDCATPHDSTEGPFCGTCGYNFDTGVSGGLPMVSVPPPIPVNSAPSTPISRPTQPQALKCDRWSLQITIDATLRLPESPEPPDLPPRMMALDQPISYLLGRTSQARAISPEISLDIDDAISHRHAIFTVQSDGSLTLRDIGSANGTMVNGVDLKPMTDLSLKPGDSITVGHWTCITVVDA